jgi:hypothetical protein
LALAVGAQGLPLERADERLLVVGEDLAVPIDLVRQHRLDGLWNEEFKRMVRCAILGQNDPKEPSFEWTARKLIDCRLLGFADGAQAINYVTSHDVEGFRNERLFNLLNNNGVCETERRIRLAFVCLMTAVGVPMIFAGEEFADQHDFPVVHPQKQVDPVNFDRLQEPWRRRVFDQSRGWFIFAGTLLRSPSTTPSSFTSTSRRVSAYSPGCGDVPASMIPWSSSPTFRISRLRDRSTPLPSTAWRTGRPPRQEALARDHAGSRRAA